MKDKILLVGVGYMGIEFAKVLKTLDMDFIAVGRGEKSAEEFEHQTGTKPFTGGLDKFLKEIKTPPATSIVAISEEQLGSATIKLIKAGVKKILVEKPGGLDFDDVKKVARTAKAKKAKVYVGYNRRFYSSVEKAREIINQDGGALSMHFDFTEAVHKIVPLVRAPGVKENWFLQNSTHVLDMAFFLGGTPKKMSCTKKGSLDWHPSGAIFTGSGETDKGVLFSYHANWKSPGRWSLEITTKKHKLYFKPLEKLQIQETGSFEVKDSDLDSKLDLDFKPGIHKETVSFFGNKKYLCTIEEQVKNLKYYSQILNAPN
jgi:predicted dehydrogenase